MDEVGGFDFTSGEVWDDAGQLVMCLGSGHVAMLADPPRELRRKDEQWPSIVLPGPKRIVVRLNPGMDWRPIDTLGLRKVALSFHRDGEVSQVQFDHCVATVEGFEVFAGPDGSIGRGFGE